MNFNSLEEKAKLVPMETSFYLSRLSQVRDINVFNDSKQYYKCGLVTLINTSGLIFIVEP